MKVNTKKRWTLTGEMLDRLNHIRFRANKPDLNLVEATHLLEELEQASYEEFEAAMARISGC